MANKKKSAVPVESIRHKDKRKNIPTEELRDFVAEDEKAPKTMLYPRDPSLDPQLVWKGKDEQDRADLAVPVVPVYIQEKIHPQALIEQFRREYPQISQMDADSEKHNLRKSVQSADQLLLFDDFNGGPTDFDQKVEFYQHEQNWANRMILGDSLLVMTSLAEKEGLKGKVQTIYFDPPYGIKFGSNWQVSTRKRDLTDGRAEDATRQPEQIRAFRDTWRLGIHSYLAYLRDRLISARELLTETGSVFVQIGDENVHLARGVLDEVFGSDNFVGQISVQKTTSATNNFLPLVCDYLLWYAKRLDTVKYRQLFRDKQLGGPGAGHYSMIELADGERRGATLDERAGSVALPDGARLFAPGGLESAAMGRDKGEGAACWFTVRFEGREFLPNEKSRWKTNEEGMSRLLLASRVVAQKRALRYVRYIDDFPAFVLTNLWTDVGGSSDKIYVVETAPEVAKRCILMTTDPGDLVLDPTCGSGTTAFVAEQWGRRWITIDTSRVALALARTRLMAAKFPYYHLADDYPQMTQMNADEEIRDFLRKSATSAQSADHFSADVRKGFVYKRVPHVTLKSIANNPDINEGMTRKQIDEAIARHAETETLFDQPYEDNKRIRVTGPFSVESLSPHRVLSTEADPQIAQIDTDSETTTSGSTHPRKSAQSVDDFAFMIIDNLRKAGVQNTRKDERLKFDRLDPFAGTWIHATGEYTEHPPNPPLDKGGQGGVPAKGQGGVPAKGQGGVMKRVAISIGPEHGTVGPQQVKEAAKEAVQGVGFDVLIVCGFAFDPHVSEEVKRYGKLTVLATRMNPDLAMGDELLKKTGAGNLFMVFGEPDVEIRRVSSADYADEHRLTKSGEAFQSNNLRESAQSAEQIVVEIKGVDVYDPTTGQIRNSSTDDIACWFIDTDYNGESFFVRHAYFTGADEPYEKLKRALRAEIDEAAWSSLYSTTSRPFDRPHTGKIAVKVINHYGDEVLKVFSV